MDDGLALHGGMRRADQFLDTGVLQQVAGDPGLDGLGEAGPGLVDREQDHPRLGVTLPDEAGGLDAVHARHPNVHEHDVRLVLVDGLHGVLAGGGLADDVDLVRDAEGRPQPVARHRVVVDDQNSHASPLRG